jgi:acyl-CoA thioester hydrolase
MQIRIYYEDTDCGGVVYYANYLRFFERARTEFLRERGIDVAAYASQGILFVVVHVDVSYRSPARYNDLLEIETRIVGHSRTTFTLSHIIRRPDADQVIVEGETTLACIGEHGRPRRFPEEMAALL